jgi:prophage maintenance system killer protein
MLLMEAKLEIDASEDEKYDFVISIAKGEIKFTEICIWIKSRIKK